MNPVEAMARAIWGASEHAFRYEQQKDYWDGIARAALTALRDCGVTPAMESDYCELVGNDIDTPELVFRAMLDAALEGN